MVTDLKHIIISLWKNIITSCIMHEIATVVNPSSLVYKEIRWGRSQEIIGLNLLQLKSYMVSLSLDSFKYHYTLV